jgi:hypothetical protein
MKLSKKALIAAAVTGVLPATAQAAALNENLVLNPSFENVNGSEALDWLGNVSTYAYSLNYTATGPAGAGNLYWFGGGGDPLASQLFDVTGNATAIDAGQIRYNLSAFFSTYRTQLDFGSVRALFLDSSNTELGRSSIGGATFVNGLPTVDNGVYSDARTWAQDGFSGLIPAGTRTIRLELDGDKEPGVGTVCDSYIDLVNFQLVAVPEPGTGPVLALGLSLAGVWMYTRRKR